MKCIRCGRELPDDRFYFDGSKGRYRSTCRDCTSGDDWNRREQRRKYPTSPSELRRIEILGLWHEGKSVPEIAALVGCPASEVHSVTWCVSRNKARARSTCKQCAWYPCFRGIDSMSSNLALTCVRFKERYKPLNF